MTVQSYRLRSARGCRPDGRNSFLIALIAAAVALLSGCAGHLAPASSVDVADQSDLAADVTYSEPGSTVQDPVPAQWWSLFNDPTLLELVERAYAGNLDLQVAAARIAESRAELGIVGAGFSPEIAFNVSSVVEGLSENGKFAALGAPTEAGNFWQGGIGASWEIDLWGRNRLSAQSAASSLRATTFEREAMRVSLTSEIASTYLKLREVQSQIALARNNEDIAERVLALTLSRQKNGVATRFEVASARSEVAVARSLQPSLIERRNALMNSLAFLLGQAPGTLDGDLSEAISIPPAPAVLAVGLSSELARRRPDILRAEAQLAAATALTGVAKADFYPRLSLSGRLGVEAFDMADLAAWDSRAFSVGPSIYLPVFQGGRLSYRLELTEARQKAAAIIYRQTVLRAWHEVDNALDAWTQQKREHSELIRYHAEAKQAYEVAEHSYAEGTVDYIAILLAQRNVLASQTRLNASSTKVSIALVDVYRALGGGWNPSSDPRE